MAKFTKYVVLIDPKTGLSVSCAPGEEVPEWATVGEHVTDGGPSAPAAPAEGAAQDAAEYDEWSVNELREEIANRNEGRDEDDRIVPGGRNKDDLVAALLADD